MLERSLSPINDNLDNLSIIATNPIANADIVAIRMYKTHTKNKSFLHQVEHSAPSGSMYVHFKHLFFSSVSESVSSFFTCFVCKCKCFIN